MSNFLLRLTPLNGAALPAAPPVKASVVHPPAGDQALFGDLLQILRPKKGVPAKAASVPLAAPAASGSRFLAETAKLSRPQREAAILKAAEAGMIPPELKAFKPVHTTWKGPDGKTHTGQYFVTPDYLMIGSGDDAVRMPMSPLTAQKVADQWGAVLPTRKMVDQIYQQAQVKLTPKPQAPGPQMMSNDYYRRHDATIDQQLADQPSGQLVAGHKKDVVLSNKLVKQPEQVAIYGWHQPSGKAIQPLSTKHENGYADYSHGVRLVARTMIVDGQPMDIQTVMTSPDLHGLVSDEGPLKVTRIPGA